MQRIILAGENISPKAQEAMGKFHTQFVSDVVATVQAQEIVVVGMAQNPFVKKARGLLDQAALSYTYLEYGSYFSKWKERLAIKLWSGWPTYPQVFVKGTLLGGCKDLEVMLKSGELMKMLGK